MNRKSLALGLAFLALLLLVATVWYAIVRGEIQVLFAGGPVAVVIALVALFVSFAPRAAPPGPGGPAGR